MTKLRGDETWIPAGRMSKDYDQDIFDTKRLYTVITSKSPSKESPRSTVPNGLSRANEQGGGTSLTSTSNASLRASQDQGAKDTESVVKPERTEVVDALHNSSAGTEGARLGDNTDLGEVEVQAGQADADDTIMPSVENPNVATENSEREAGQDVAEEAEGSTSPPRRITRAQAQADKAPASPRSESLRESGSPQLHPLFLLPAETKPDADLGLPPLEAIETRQLLSLYVQKQEEVCRASQRLYEGLLQADRQRKEVLKWCKAEGHVGEMSDGEDWYDKEEWGLQEDLRKGHAEEEEDTIVQGKKTRGRRA